MTEQATNQIKYDSSLRAEAGAQRRPKAKQSRSCKQDWIASSQELLAMTNLKASFC
jgi:hypothetical protein